MFEDSLVDSGGKLKTNSSKWMMLTLAINASIVAVLILIPLLYPEALPKTAMTAMLSAPPPPPPGAGPGRESPRPASDAALRSAAAVRGRPGPGRCPRPIAGG